MTEYVYILTNPSMPGLIKLGRTSLTPSQRMEELHSTGVPTPFSLEFSAEVEDCAAAERAAHRALAKYRVTVRREFFRVSVRKALEAVLPALGPYTIHFAADSHGIFEIERALQQQRLAEEQRIAEKRRRQESEKRERLQARKQRAEEIQRALRVERDKLDTLGARPIKEELSGLSTLLLLLYYPFPIGAFFWIGALGIFDPGRQGLGLFCVSTLIAGYFASRRQRRYEAEYEVAYSQFRPLDDRIATLERELKELGTPMIDGLSDHLQNQKAKSKRIRNSCPRCQTLLVRSVERSTATCPSCDLGACHDADQLGIIGANEESKVAPPTTYVAYPETRSPRRTTRPHRHTNGGQTPGDWVLSISLGTLTHRPSGKTYNPFDVLLSLKEEDSYCEVAK